MRAGASSVKTGSYEVPSADRQTVRLDGHGSAKAAITCITTGDPVVTGKSKIATHGRLASFGAVIGGAGMEVVRALPAGSATARAVINRIPCSRIVVITKLRAGDGVHFTRAGARKLAYFVEGDVRRLIEKQTPVVDPAIADGAPLERAPEPAQKSQQFAIPAPPAIVLPLRPDKGPVVPLTGLALSPGGELAGSARKTDQRDQQSRAIVEQVLIEGRPMEQAPTGRADDFRWPRR